MRCVVHLNRQGQLGKEEGKARQFSGEREGQLKGNGQESATLQHGGQGIEGGQSLAASQLWGVV